MLLLRPRIWKNRRRLPIDRGILKLRRNESVRLVVLREGCLGEGECEC